jgi:hypothetical protein
MFYSSNFNNPRMPYLTANVYPSRIANIDLSNVITQFTQIGIS